MTQKPLFILDILQRINPMSKGFPSHFQKNIHFSAHILKLSHTNFTRFTLLHQTFRSLRQQTDQSAAVKQNSCDCKNLNISVFIQIHAHIQFYIQKSTFTQNISVVYVFMLHYSVRL